MEEIKGRIEFVLYSSDEYSVCKFVLDNGIHTTVVGSLPDVKDIPMVCYGEWFLDKKFGKEFKVQRYELIKPKDKKGVIAYLCSLHCGIGKVWADKIYAKFGEDTWSVLEQTPEKLLEIDKFSEKKLKALTEKLNETELVRQIMSVLNDKVELGLNKAEVIAQTFGSEAVSIIKEKPYNLILVKGLGFKTVEDIAKKFNADPTDFMRIQGCMFYVLDLFEKKGHSCVMIDTLVEYMSNVLNKGFNPKIITKERCVEVINHNIKYHHLYKEEYQNKENKTKQLIFTPDSYFAEEAIARNIYRISKGIKFSFSDKDIYDAIEKFSNANTFKLAHEQKKAIKTALSNPVSVITGGPGTGKSTVVKAMLWVFQYLYSESNPHKSVSAAKPLLLAPTGRASRRLSESTGYEAGTIHSNIGFVQGETGKCYATVDCLDANLIVVDEMSMTDQNVMKLFLETVPDDARVVFIGDPYQLPSVGCGNVLSDIIQTNIIPVVKLKVIFRQGKDSPIVGNSQAILKGNKKLDYSTGFYHKEVLNDKQILVDTCRFYANCVSKFGIDNVVLLSPFREKTEISVDSFNKQLQHYYNPPDKSKDKPLMKAHGTEFRVGDKIMQTKNTEHAMNGDIGYVKDITYTYTHGKDSKFTTVCVVEFNNSGELLNYTVDDMKNVELAYALTVHKSQGSEYKTVIFVASMSHQIALKRNLLYTAITRASENVAIIGQPEAVEYAIDNIDATNRVTYLRNRIRKYFKGEKEYEEEVKTIEVERGEQLTII